MDTVELVERLIADVRSGTLDPPPQQLTSRQRLIATLEQLSHECKPCDRRELEALPPDQRINLLVRSTLAQMFQKLSRFSACMACTLSPCICDRLPPLRLSHRLWVVQHHKEALRTTASGKLLLLAHPDSHLLVSGVPAHDEELQRLCMLPTTALLWPAPDACSPQELLCSLATASADDSDGTSGDCQRHRPTPCLDLVVLDGTWNQARHMARSLPTCVRKVVVDCSHMRSTFGTRVRKQGAAREEAGRVSTLEAYAHLALALGDARDEVCRLAGHMEVLISALPHQRPAAAAADDVAADQPDGNGGSDGGSSIAPARPPLPPRSPTNPYRRRARKLMHALTSKVCVGGPPARGSHVIDPGRECVAALLEAQPQFMGVALQWEVAGGVATLVGSTRRGADGAGVGGSVGDLVASWPLAELGLGDEHTA